MDLTAAELNKIGNHVLSDGSIYDGFFPEVDCNKDIGFSYANFGKKYKKHTIDISSEIKGNTLVETISNIHWFLYSHIQYKTIIPQFLIKSPSCAWQSRTEGSDCKTYTTFASSILTNLNIKHYLRSVKYREGSHIYVIVPLNQLNYKLNSSSTFGIDYLIIDSAGKTNQEKPFLKKHFDAFINPKTPPISFGLVSVVVLASILIINKI